MTFDRIRDRLTYANVMSTVAVFFVLGGGTALAAYVINSNADVGPDTISGHSPPAGDHSNIIAGSVNGQDLANKSVTGKTVKDGSLSVSDVGFGDAWLTYATNSSILGLAGAGGTCNGHALQNETPSSVLKTRQFPAGSYTAIAKVDYNDIKWTDAGPDCQQIDLSGPVPVATCRLDNTAGTDGYDQTEIGWIDHTDNNTGSDLDANLEYHQTATLMYDANVPAGTSFQLTCSRSGSFGGTVTLVNRKILVTHEGTAAQDGVPAIDAPPYSG